MHIYLRTLAVQQMQSLEDHVRLVVIHPNYTEQHLILGEFLDKDAVYVRFTGAQLTAAMMREQLKDTLVAQSGSDRLDGISHLILDECDRAHHAQLDILLSELVMNIGQGRVILFSRVAPPSCLPDGHLAARAAFIPGDKSFMLWDYARHDGENALLEVRAFGEGRVYLNGKLISNWDGILPRSLFFYLVDRGMATRNEIFATFWPNLTVREATNVFHVTKRKISEVLGLDLTAYWSGFYHISPKLNLSYDVVLFTDLLQQSAVASVDDAADLLYRATALCKGYFLTSIDMEWVRNRRGELAQNFGEALAGLARSKEDNGHVHDALGLYLRAAVNNRHREDLVSNIMTLYRNLNMRADALMAYDRLVEELMTLLGVLPAPQLQALADEIRQELNGGI